MKELSQIDLMNELGEEAVVVLKELIDEQVKPLVQYRMDMEKKIANKEINELYKLEAQAR